MDAGQMHTVTGRSVGADEDIQLQVGDLKLILDGSLSVSGLGPSV